MLANLQGQSQGHHTKGPTLEKDSRKAGGLDLAVGVLIDWGRVFGSGGGWGGRGGGGGGGGEFLAQWKEENKLKERAVRKVTDI